MAGPGFSSLDQVAQAAAAGDAPAQEKMALAYVEGWGVDKDYEKARDWYERAAAQDDPGGHFGLAVLYALGWGVDADPIVAYMRLVLMNRRRDVLKQRWNGQTVQRMLATLDQLAERLTDDEKTRAENLARDWCRRNGLG